MKTTVTFRFDFNAIGNTEYASGQARIKTDRGTYFADINYFDETEEGDSYGKGFDIEMNENGRLLFCRMVDLNGFMYRTASPAQIEKLLEHDLCLMVEGYERNNK